VPIPSEWKNKPLGSTRLTMRAGRVTWSCTLQLKTHYVYSMTAAQALGGGMENGLILFRSIDDVSRTGGRRRVTFSSTPLILGNGALAIP
jgi:hypothetical protein